MRAFIIILIVIVFAISVAVFGFKYWQGKQAAGNAPVNLEKTITGVLQPISFTGEYSDVISVNNQLVGVTSNTINLKPYENRKVEVRGQYSGNTMYADFVTILP